MSSLKRQIKQYERGQLADEDELYETKQQKRTRKRRQKSLKRALRRIRARKSLKALRRSSRLKAIAARAAADLMEQAKPDVVFTRMRPRYLKENDRVRAVWLLEWSQYDENSRIVERGDVVLMGLGATETPDGIRIKSSGRGPDIDLVYDPSKERRIQKEIETAFLNWATG